MDAEQVAHLHKLLTETRQRLRVRELQTSRYGIDTPPHVQTEIDDLRTTIATYEQQIRNYRSFPTETQGGPSPTESSTEASGPNDTGALLPDSDKLLSIASSLKTPFALAALVVAILYLIYRQVLSLGVFSNIGADPTFHLLQNVLDKLFWLALVAIILSLLSYIVTIVLRHKTPSRSSRVVLINASLDPRDSPYEQSVEDGVKTIRPKD